MNKRLFWSGIVFLVILAGLGVYLIFSYEVKDFFERKDIVYATEPLVPKTLVIPKLGIEADVEHVGKNAAGNMAVPKRYQDVAWYEPGYMPGEAGNAAIAGHVDNSLGLHGVFYNLHEIEVGDEVFVKDKDGKTLKFEVLDKKVYEYYSAPLEEIFGESDEKRLSIITCTGEWDASARTYRERLIVHTRLVE